MTAPLSIIIPTLNAERSLLRLIPQLFEGLTEGLITELIFADGGSSDQTLAIAEDAGALVVTTPKGRGTQLKAGGEAAKGSWLLFLHADSKLPDDWNEVVRDHMENHAKQAAVFRLSFDDPSPMAKVTAAWANFRSKRLNLPYGDQGLLISSQLYGKVGGFDSIPLMEDVEMSKKLRGQIRLLNSTITTNADRYQREGWLKRGALNISTLLLYNFGRSPEALLQRYNQSDHKSS